MRNAIIVIAIICLIAYSCHSQSKAISTETVGSIDYRWISFLTEGEITWLSDSVQKTDSIVGYSFRIVITTSEVYNRIYIEKVIVGEEGCCKRVLSTRAIDMHQYQRKFGIKGEMAGINFSKWLSPTSFQFQQFNRKFNITNIDKRDVSIKEISVSEDKR